MPGIPKPKTAEPIRYNQLRLFVKQGKELFERIDEIAVFVKDQPDETICTYNWATAVHSLEGLQKFVEKLHSAKSRAELGNPLEPGQLTDRSTAKKQAVEVLKKGVESINKKNSKRK